MEVEIGLVPVAASASEDAEGEAPPGLGMDGAIEEGPARDVLVVQPDRERVMPDRVLERAPDRLGVLFRIEAHRRAVGPGRVGT